MALAGGIVVVTVDRKDRDTDVDVQVFIVHVVEGALEVFAGIAQQFQLARLVSETVHANRAHYLVHGLSRRLVLMEEIAC
jgi:hypothetical protein